MSAGDGFVIWITGLPAAGKTTLARAVENVLARSGRVAEVFDGDAIRATICRDLGFSEQDRTENVRRVAALAATRADAGMAVVVALISPLRAQREEARRIVGRERFVEVHVSTGLSICEGRDPKGHYRRARAGELPRFTGVSDPYEPPDSPDLSLDMGVLAPEEAAARVITRLAERRLG